MRTLFQLVLLTCLAGFLIWYPWHVLDLPHRPTVLEALIVGFTAVYGVPALVKYTIEFHSDDKS